jgi:hypothetical protein
MSKNILINSAPLKEIVELKVNPPIQQLKYPLQFANELYGFPIDPNNGKGQKIGILTGGSWFLEYSKINNNNFSQLINDLKQAGVIHTNSNLKIIINDPTNMQDYTQQKNIQMNTLLAEEGEGLLDLGVIISCCPSIEEIHILPYSLGFEENSSGEIKLKTNIPEHLEYCIKNNISVVSCSYGAYLGNIPTNSANTTNSKVSKIPDIESVLDKEDDRIFGPYHKKLTICVASGDNGGCNIKDTNTCIKDTSFPTSSKYVLSVGGTQYSNELQTQFDIDLNNEQAWSQGLRGESGGIGSGGGGITPMRTPEFQKYLKDSSKRRLIPDVSGLAQDKWYLPVSALLPSQNSNQIFLYGGTSAVAPLYASFFVIVNQKRKQYNKSPLGFVNNKLYSAYFENNNNNIFNDITKGQISAGYEAKPNYDMATGLGTPNFKNLMKLLVNETGTGTGTGKGNGTGTGTGNGNDTGNGTGTGTGNGTGNGNGTDTENKILPIIIYSVLGALFLILIIVLIYNYYYYQK